MGPLKLQYFSKLYAQLINLLGIVKVSSVPKISVYLNHNKSLFHVRRMIMMK